VNGNPLDRTAAVPPVVVHTPTGRDGALVAQLLRSGGISVEAGAAGAELAQRLQGPVGALVLAEEALDLETARRLRDHLRSPPGPTCPSSSSSRRAAAYVRRRPPSRRFASSATSPCSSGRCSR
jgi:hypothetical protein